MDQEPDLSLLKPKRWGIVPTLLVALLVLVSAAVLYTAPPRKLPKPPPPPKPGPLFVTVRPAADPVLPSALPADRGWCCAGLQGSAPRLTAASRSACEAGKGTFFAIEDQARQACGPAASTATSGSPRGRGKGA